MQSPRYNALTFHANNTQYELVFYKFQVTYAQNFQSVKKMLWLVSTFHSLVLFKLLESLILLYIFLMNIRTLQNIPEHYMRTEKNSNLCLNLSGTL